MKRTDWNWRSEVAGAYVEELTTKCGRWLNHWNDQFRRWSIRIPRRRLTFYMVFMGVMVIGCNIFLLTYDFKGPDSSHPDEMILPRHIKSEPKTRDELNRRAVRARVQLDLLLDSLRRDSNGRALLDQMIKAHAVLLDSSLVR